MPRRYSICGKQSDAEYTKEPARCKLVCRSRCNASRLAIAEDSADEWAVRHTHISRQTAAGNGMLLYRGATVYAASIAMPNIRGYRCAANKFAAAEACGICGCRKATVYLQIGCGQATETAMPRRYSICGKQSAAEYTRKFKHLNHAERQNPAANPLTTSMLQDFQCLYPRFRC